MKYALALGGGGARGAFEAGVWRAIRDMNKEITAIAGTSVGAINGAAFAAGADCEGLWCKMSAEKLVPGAADGNIMSAEVIGPAMGRILKGGLDIEPMRKMLEGVIDEDRVRKSGIDYGLCAFSAGAKESAELFLDRIPQGRLIDYITASACFPVFRPVRINGEDFTDGGVRNNIPVNMLIERGYDAIISVAVKGVGVVKDIDRRGINIIEIEYQKPECGIMEFDEQKIKRSIKSGYLSCMKAFGRVSGRKFFINNKSYASAVYRYGHELIDGIEEAAYMSGVDRLQSYSFTALVRAVMACYKDSPALLRLTELIEREPPCMLHDKLDMLRHFRAANAIVYMKRKV